MKKPKSEKWLKAMADRKGRGTNQYTKAKLLGLPKPELTEEQIKKRSNHQLGRKHSEETKNKIKNLYIFCCCCLFVCLNNNIFNKIKKFSFN